MGSLDIILAVILTALGFAILAALITRRSRQSSCRNEVSRCNAEQSAVLLDYEDGVNCGQSRVKGGSRCTFSTGSGASTSVGQSAGSLGICPSTPDRNTSTKSLREFMSANSGRISRTLGPIMQFSAPIPGATGPIKLSQKTLVQTPGYIGQYSAFNDPSDTCCRVGSNVGMECQAICPPPPTAICCPQPVIEPVCCRKPIIKPICCQKRVTEPICCAKPVIEPICCPKPVIEPICCPKPVIEPICCPQPVIEPVCCPKRVIEPICCPKPVIEPICCPQPVIEPICSSLKPSKIVQECYPQECERRKKDRAKQCRVRF